MELRQLRYAEAVARHRHFTRAAEELHVAQSALSHQIRRLERELGTELFRRTSRRVELTEAGAALAARARRVLAEVEGARGDIDELEGLVRGHLAVGALLPAGELDVPRLLAAFSATYPDIELQLREGTAGDMLRYLNDDEVDVAFSLLAAEPPDNLASERVSEEELVAVFPPGESPPANDEAIGASQLADRPLVTFRSGSAVKAGLDDFFAAAGERLQVSLESGDPFLLRCLVADGFGAAVLPRSLVEREGPPVEARPLDPPIRFPVALLWHRDRHQPPAAQALIEFVRGAARTTRRP